MDWKDTIVDARHEGEYVIFYSSVGEVGRIKETFSEGLREWYTLPYKIKCDTMANNLEHVVRCLRKEL